MNNEPNPPGKAGTPAPSPSEKSAAVEFVQRELDRARSSLTRSRLAAIILVLIVLGYMSFVVASLKPYLEPEPAAAMATQYLAEQVRENGPELTSYLKERIPALIAEGPEYLRERLPEFRKAIEDRVEADFKAYCRTTSTQLDLLIDDYLTMHKGDIQKLLKEGDDPETIKLLGTHMEQSFRSYLEKPTEDGESLKQKLDKSLADLQRIEDKTTHLAKSDKLTPAEMKTRRAIAVTWQQVAAE